MDTPLNASSITAGALMSNSTFEVPIYQREYSWLEDEVSEFWSDLSNSLGEGNYFLGLVILTDENNTKQVVDGQQRIITLTLLASALYHNAIESQRSALAERIQSTFLRSIDYETDETLPRVTLSDDVDNKTLQSILEGSISEYTQQDNQYTFSKRLINSYLTLKKKLKEDLASDPFKRLGIWTDFLTNHLYFAVFIHPDAASAYRVFEVINTRGRELTTADLLKNFILSQFNPADRDKRYKQWQAISNQFPASGNNSLVQYIRHVVTVEDGYILPKDLFDYVAQRVTSANRNPPSPPKLIELLEEHLPLYRQMIDPTLEGPAEAGSLEIFDALNTLGVISLRPLLMAISEKPNAIDGMQYVLNLVVRRIVVGNLGTGTVDKRFGEAAKAVNRANDWHSIMDDLADLNPSKEEFIKQLTKRSFNKTTLAFLRRSIIASSTTPGNNGTLHYILSRGDLTEEVYAYWSGTIANTFLANLERRPKEAEDWSGFKRFILPNGIDGEWKDRLEEIDAMNALSLESIGKELAEAAGDVWY